MIRTLIIEDEAPAAQRLKKLLQETDPEIRVVEILDSVRSAVRWLRYHAPPDLMMLDIQLGDGQSFDIFKEVKADSFVIFTTAYDEYAIRAFELNSVDYLLKPVDREKLATALKKLKNITGKQAPVDLASLMKELEQSRPAFKERFLVNVASQIRSVETNHIAYFYSLNKQCYLCTSAGRNYPVDQSLEQLGEILDPSRFFRINRNYILSYQAIEKIRVLSRSRISIQVHPPTDQPLLVSTARGHKFRQWLDR